MLRKAGCGLVASLVLGVSFGSAAQPPSAEEVRALIADCRSLDTESDRLFCRHDVFQTFGALSALARDEAEAFLVGLAGELDQRSVDACGSPGSPDRERLAQWAVRVWERLIASLRESCGEDPSRHCGSERVARIRETMERYVRALVRRAAVNGVRPEDVTYQLAWEFSAGYLDRTTLRLWEGSICDCSRTEPPRCSGPGGLCRGDAVRVCEDDGECGALWCEYGEKLAQLDGLPHSFTELRTRLSRTPRCRGVVEDGT